MKFAGIQLNIAGCLRGVYEPGVMLHAAIDVEGHQGDDGQYEQAGPHNQVGQEHNLVEDKMGEMRRDEGDKGGLDLSPSGDPGLAGPAAAGGGQGQAPHPIPPPQSHMSKHLMYSLTISYS
jgi:hypothetical protein